MGGKHTGANYDLAKAEADKVDAVSYTHLTLPTIA